MNTLAFFTECLNSAQITGHVPKLHLALTSTLLVPTLELAASLRVDTVLFAIVTVVSSCRWTRL